MIVFKRSVHGGMRAIDVTAIHPGPSFICQRVYDRTDFNSFYGVKGIEVGEGFITKEETK